MRKSFSNIGVGASSLMLIIVVVCLTIFAVLTYVTARNDAALSQRTLKSVQRYYETDALAQKALMAIDKWQVNGMLDMPEGVTITTRDNGMIEFMVSTGETHMLKVALRMTDNGYMIEHYRYENSTEWIVDLTEELFF